MAHQPIRRVPDEPDPDATARLDSIDSDFGIRKATPGIVPGGLVGRRLGNIEIEAFVAAGGMGEVYRGREVKAFSGRRIVAVKVIKSARSTQAARQRFDHETEILGKLGHPRIAGMLYGDEALIDGVRVPYFVMHFIADARRIDDHVRDGVPGPGFDRRSIVSLFLEVVDAIAACHAEGIVHCDLKPGNILVDRNGAPHVVDFGVACRTGTVGRVRAGTPAYMSPEHKSGGTVDCRFDVYALGMVLAELIAASRRGPRHAADDRVDAIVAACRATDPQRRPASAGELAGMLRRWLESPRPPRPTTRPRHTSLGCEPLEQRVPFAGDLGAPPAVGAAEPPARVYAYAASPAEPVSAGRVATVPPGGTVTLTAAGLASRLPDARARGGTVRNVRLARGGGDGRIRAAGDDRWTLDVGPLRTHDGSVLTLHFEVHRGGMVQPATAVVLVQPPPRPGPGAFAKIEPGPR